MRGVGVDQDFTSASLTAPNVKAQEKLLRATMNDGLPAVSVQWPALSGLGTAAAMDEGVKIDSRMSFDNKAVAEEVTQLAASMFLAETSQVQCWTR